MKKDITPSKIAESVTYTQSFAAVVKYARGKKRLCMKSVQWFQYSLDKFKEGEEVTFELHNKKPKRSLAQNAYLWGAFYPLIAQETGESDLNRLHELFKGKFLTIGIVKVLGESVRIKKSSTELSVSEFSSFIQSISELTGIQPPPIESYGLDNLNDSLDSV